MKTLRIMALLLFAAAALSCRREELPYLGLKGYYRSDVEVRASAALPEGWAPMPKAVGDITDIDNSEFQARGFGVYAFYTGSESYSAATDSSAYTKFGLVLNNRQFTYSGGVWSNNGKAEFWPTADDDNLSLFAYAPWDTWSGVVAYDGKVPSIQYDNYVAQNLSVSELSKQRDILWGTNTSGNPHIDRQKDDYATEGTVDFHFRHAVAKVRLNVKGTLPGEVRNMTSSGTSSSSNGATGDTEDGPTTTTLGDPVFNVANNSTYYRSSGNTRYFHAVQTQTETESIVQTRYRTRTETSTGAVYSVSGQRYMVEEVTLKGFNKTGTLVLDNPSAYIPQWTNVTRFTGATPEYVLNSSNVLSQGLRYVSASTIQNNFSTYTGITESAAEMMSGYFLYAIPRESSAGDRIAVTIDYHKLNVSGTLTANQTRQVVQKQTRTISRSRERSRQSEEIALTRGMGENWTSAYNSRASHESDYTFSADWGAWGSWSSWSSPSWGEWTDDSATDWTITSETLTGATVNYNDDTAPHLSGEIITDLEGGRVYDINLIVAGDKIELEVVPQPWDLKEFDFDYNANINDVIQALTYDSSYIDYADAQGNVWINNRMGKFYFKLGAGKYASWQASLVGDAAFGFCDENGNFLLNEHGQRVNSIRRAIDPDVMNYIYVKPIDTEATVTSHAKLRIYYIDATGDAVVALNLVNQGDIREWTIWQNAN
ncbi:MAG: hypothetical protein J6W09_04125 [Bacteroidales bacterium]|nr:hypothetical protein [Bacteroidales bacterium]